MTIKIGEKKGNFLIKAEIGRGGMGTIYSAVDTMLNRDIALKVVHPELASNGQLMERFKTEAMTQGQMNHPNIVTVFSFTKIDEENIIAMEYVDGKNLKTLLQEQNILSISDSINYLKQILEALKFSHSRNIIHRDIKPANILITNDNQLKLSDFGIAKVFGKQGLTKTGMLLGTPWYTPPEQIMGGVIDYRSDLYSVGITFYEMVTGKVPFDSETNSDFQVQKAHLETPPPRPSIFNPEIGSKVEKFILKALQKKPEKRFQSAAEMLKALESIENKITETKITRSGDYHITQVEPGEIYKEKSRKVMYGLISVFFIICLTGAYLYFFVLKDTTSVKVEKIPGQNVKNNSDIAAGDQKKEKVVKDEESVIEKNEVPLKSVEKKEEQKAPLKKELREEKDQKKKEIIKPKIIPAENKKVEKKPAEEPSIIKEKIQKDVSVSGAGKIDDVNLEAELIRLKRLIEKRDVKKAEAKIYDLMDSGIKNPGLYSIAGGLKFLQGKLPEAENFWKTAIETGGSVVLRFFHKHGFFNKGCSGQVILKKGLIIFNSVTKSSHSFAVTSEMVKAVKKRKGTFGLEISFYVKKKVKKHIFILRRKSRNKEKFISEFINKYILEVK